MNLTVVTLTDPSFNRDLTRCIQSVKDALPEKAKHEIIECNSFDMWIKTRYDIMKLDDIVVLVDDDDYISKDSLHYVSAALNETDAGFAYTREVMIEAGMKPRCNRPTTEYSRFPMGPQTVHHMMAYNTKYVTDRSWNLMQKMQLGLEWMMRVDAAANNGAIHIPIDGYFWVQHSGQTCADPSLRISFEQKIPLIIKELSEWMTRTGAIPTWKIPK